MTAAWADWVMHWLDAAGLWGLAFAMLLDGFCVPVPSELILPFGGFLAAAGDTGVWPAVLAANTGLLVGSALAYAVGRVGGRPLLERAGPYLGVGPAQILAAERWFHERGDWAVFLARFLPGLRTLVSLPAGVAGMPFGRFLWITFLGSLPWSFALTYAGYLLGHQWPLVQAHLHLFDRVALALVALLVGGWLFRRWRGRSRTQRT